MPEQRELFNELELYDACSRFRKCRKCKRRLHADHKERFKTRVAGLCFQCLREFNESEHWTVDAYIDHDRKTLLEFVEAADDFENLFGETA